MTSEFTDVIKLWQSFHIKNERDLDLRLHNFRILFVYNSGKIENKQITYQDTREIFENGQVKMFAGDPRTLFEQQNQKMCYEYLKPLIVQKAPLTIDLILEVHRILTSGTYDHRRFIELGERPGEFKKNDFVTGIMEVGSRPDEVEADLAELLAELEEHEGRDILKTSAYFHLRFEHIHPFTDGNGRVGRTMLNYYLMIHDCPPIIIFEEDNASYYQVLQQYDESEMIELMVQFLEAQAIKTWQKTLTRGQRKQ